MTAWIYRKPEATDVRGLCVICNKNKQKRIRLGKYQALCSLCDARRFNIKPRLKKEFHYRRFKKNICERCGFIAKHMCQLDVHHKDGQHHNNDPANLETLCANCHRLEHLG